MSKNIGLCVCYDQRNFGSQLQVLATIHAVEQFGCDYEIIRYKKKLTPAFCLKSVPRLLNRNFISARINKQKRNKAISRYPEIEKQIAVRTKRFDQFAKERFGKVSKVSYGYKELSENAKKYDSVLTGSDQLWLPGNLGSHFYTQEFVPAETNKVSYATSFGVSNIPWYQRKRTAGYLKRFQHVSCREQRGTEIIRELAGIEAFQAVDPTLLFDRDGWKEMIGEKRTIQEPYIFCYFLGKMEECRTEASKYAKEKGLTVVTTPFMNNYVPVDRDFGDMRLYDIDSNDFVNLIRNAEFVMTDSFHGSVFSIIHHKKFVTFNRFSNDDSNSRNSRIDSLLGMLDLQDRRYKGSVKEIADADIRYENVDAVLKQKREESWNYLRTALKG